MLTIVYFQFQNNRLHSFFQGGGESLIGLLGNAGFMFEAASIDISKEPILLEHKIKAASFLISRNTSRLFELLTPYIYRPTIDDLVFTSPPKLSFIPAALFPFLLIGLYKVLTNLKDPRHFYILASIFLSIPPLLLCTYIGTFRSYMLMFQLSLLCAIGLYFVIGNLGKQASKITNLVLLPTMISFCIWQHSGILDYNKVEKNHIQLMSSILDQVKQSQSNLLVTSNIRQNYEDYIRFTMLLKQSVNGNSTMNFKNFDELYNKDSVQLTKLLSSNLKEHESLQLIVGSCDVDIATKYDQIFTSLPLETMADNQLSEGCRLRVFKYKHNLGQT